MKRKAFKTSPSIRGPRAAMQKLIRRVGEANVKEAAQQAIVDDASKQYNEARRELEAARLDIERLRIFGVLEQMLRRKALELCARLVDDMLAGKACWTVQEVHELVLLRKLAE